MEQAGHGGKQRDDGYRDFPLPAFGSLPDASDEQVTDICTRWFVAEVLLVRNMMGGICRRYPDLCDDAGAITAFSYFRAVRSGNGIARFVRHHIQGQAPIQTPKAVFISTIEHHRRDAIAWIIAEGERGREQEPVPEDALGDAADPRRMVVAGTDHADNHRDQCMRIRDELVELATTDEAVLPPDAATQVAALLDRLESLSHESLRRHGRMAGLTKRQRLVFLLRTDPLNADHGTMLEYEQIVALSGILGNPTRAVNLRKLHSVALERLRIDHPDLKDELSDG